MTKREMYDVIANVFNEIENENKDEILTFVEKEKAALDRRTESARKRAAAKRAEKDVIYGKLEAILDEADAPMTVNELLVALDDENLTPAKVISRMTGLVKENIAAKTIVKDGDRKLVGYYKA